MKKNKILVINLGGTSTKCSIFENDNLVADYEMKYTPEEENLVSDGKTQVRMKTERIQNWLSEEKQNISDFDAIAIRGGGTFNGKNGGTYRVEGALYDHLKKMYTPDIPPTHAARICIGVVDELLKDLDHRPPIFSTDPCSVDQLPAYARVTGCPDFKRRASFHALNQRAVARLAAEDIGKTYDTARIIVAHCGGGVSVAAHDCGRVVEVNDSTGDGDGPFSANRAGSVPGGQLVHMCFSGQYSEQEILYRLKNDSGLKGYLGTSDLREIEARIENGDDQAKLIYDALVYQISTQIGVCYVAMNCECDIIAITAGMAKSKRLISDIEKRVGKIAPVRAYTGDYENKALAMGALRVLTGEEKPAEYTGEEGYMQPVKPWKQ